MEIMKRLFTEEEGQGMVEYALIIGLIAIVLVTAAASDLGTALDSVIEKITDALAE